jgi:hypothetical protein
MRRTAGVALMASCAVAPSPAQTPPPLAELEDQYDHPTAVISESVARQVIALAPRYTSTQALALRFLPATLRQVSASPVGEGMGTPGSGLQGSVSVHAVCPGDGTSKSQDEAVDGSIDIALGVEDSSIKRTFSARAKACRFQGRPPGTVTVTGAFVVDMGFDVPLDHLTPQFLLMEGTKVSATIDLAHLPTAPLALDRLDLRLMADGTTELRLDLSRLGVGPLGAAILAFHPDGAIGLRVRNGEWVCGSKVAPCVLQ